MRFCLNVLANCHFRFEYPPAPTPKKKASAGGKTETFKVIYLLYLSSPEHCGHQRLELACISAKCVFFYINGLMKAPYAQILQDQQVGDTVTTDTGEKRISAVSTGEAVC